MPTPDDEKKMSDALNLPDAMEKATGSDVTAPNVKRAAERADELAAEEEQAESPDDRKRG